MVLASAFSCVEPSFVGQEAAAEEVFQDCDGGRPAQAPLRCTRSEPLPRGSDSSEDVCWICLDPAGAHGPLERPCACPRSVHAMCLARWQLHSAGRDEERVCRFCHTELKDWKPVMTEGTGAKVVTPYMRVSFNGKTYKVQVQPGPEGAAAFERQIRSLLQLPEGLEFDVIFHCRAPGTGDKLQLQGLNAFDAAVHCASLSNKGGANGAGDRRSSRKPAGAFSRLLAALGCRTSPAVPEAEAEADTAENPAAVPEEAAEALAP